MSRTICYEEKKSVYRAIFAVNQKRYKFCVLSQGMVGEGICMCSLPVEFLLGQLSAFRRSLAEGIAVFLSFLPFVGLAGHFDVGDVWW